MVGTMDDSTKRLVKNIGLTLLVPLLVVVVFVCYVIHERSEKDVYTVEGPSMENTFHSGDKIKVTHDMGVTPAVSNVFVFSEPSAWKLGSGKKTIVKRIEALPGDTVTVVSDVHPGAGIYVNGNKTHSFPKGYTCDKDRTIKLDGDAYLARGDNPLHSTDSVRLLCDGRQDFAVKQSDILSYGNAAKE